MLTSATRSKKSARNSYTQDPVVGTTVKNKSNKTVWNVLSWLVGLGLGVALLLGLVVGVLQLYRMATTSDFFAIRRIEIRGSTHFKREAILDVSGLQYGKNSLTVNIADIEKALRTNPWISKVAVKRRLPDVFEIFIEERVPAFWMLNDGTLQYVDNKGEVIAPVEAGNFLSLPTLEVLPGGDVLKPQVEAMVKSLRVAKLPLDMAAVSWVRISAAKGFELYLENRNLTLCVAPENWSDNLQRLGVVLNDLARRGELKKASEIWASEGSVWVVQTPEQG